jgi:hypothetical protein
VSSPSSKNYPDTKKAKSVGPHDKLLPKTLSFEVTEEPVAAEDCHDTIGGGGTEAPEVESRYIHYSCEGFTKEMLEGNSKLKDTKKVFDGFCHLVGKGIHNFGSAMSNKKSWPYSDNPKVVGVLRYNNVDLYTVSRVELNSSEPHAIHSTRCQGFGIVLPGQPIPQLCEGCGGVANAFYR